MSTDLPGFADPVTDAQGCFRAVLDAMAHPGRITHAGSGLRAPAPLAGSTGAVLLTLADTDTPIWLDPAAEPAESWIRFHCGAPGATPDDASFAVCLDLPPLETFPWGSHDGPETSTTIILQRPSLDAGPLLRLSGPGLQHPELVRLGLPEDFARRWQANHAAFPPRRRPHHLLGRPTGGASPQHSRGGGLMAYVATKGGEQAIAAAHAWLAEQRRGDGNTPELGTGQIEEQLGRAVDRVMGEGSVYDRGLAALAIKQAQGDLIEAAFLLRAYRTTLPRFAASLPVETAAMEVMRRVSAIYKDLPGGQVLGPTYDYTHRLLDFTLAANGEPPPPVPAADEPAQALAPVSAILAAEGLIEGDGAQGPSIDLTREPLAFPAARATRLQALSRADEGFLLSLGYSTQRGWGGTHPFVGEIRVGTVSVEIEPPELGFPIDIGDVAVTECQMVNQFAGSKTEPPQFTRGYGLCFGQSERKAMSMALVDRAMRSAELGEDVMAPAQDVEFVMYHCDNVEATGFVEHLKLPHYVDFQSELETIRRMRADAETQLAEAAE